MSAYPELTKLPDVVYIGQIGDCFATAQTDEGAGLLVFLNADCHQRSQLPEAMKGIDPVEITRERVMELCNVCYLVDPDEDAYVSFLIRDTVNP